MTLGEAFSGLLRRGLARLDAQMLVLLAAGHDPHDRAWMLTHDDLPLSASALVHLEALATRRLGGEPMAYLRGEQAFHGLGLKVDARVLVPRADTETLVDWALDLLPTLPEAARVIDLGTGSGAIALALRRAAPHVDMTATDRSADALAVAEANARRLGMPLRLRAGHWLEAVPGETFDLVVSNPPYIADNDPHLAALTHEPLTALTAGPDGLRDLRTIIVQATQALRPGGWLLLEHGFDQAAAVQDLLRAQRFEAIDSRTDLAGIARCTAGRQPGAR